MVMAGTMLPFLGLFAKLQKVTSSFFMCVCLVLLTWFWYAIS